MGRIVASLLAAGLLARYLDGICLRPAAITPTGQVWVFGHDRDRQDPGVYVILPQR